jgi:hypothetical protein
VASNVCALASFCLSTFRVSVEGSLAGRTKAQGTAVNFPDCDGSLSEITANWIRPEAGLATKSVMVPNDSPCAFFTVAPISWLKRSDFWDIEDEPVEDPVGDNDEDDDDEELGSLEPLLEFSLAISELAIKEPLMQIAMVRINSLPFIVLPFVVGCLVQLIIDKADKLIVARQLQLTGWREVDNGVVNCF